MKKENGMKKNGRLFWAGVQTALIFTALRVMQSDALVAVREFSMRSQWGIKNLFLTLYPYSIFQTVLFFALFLLVAYAPQKKAKWGDGCFAALFSGLMLLGYGFHRENSCALLWERPVNLMMTVLSFFGIVLLVLILLRWLPLLKERIFSKEWQLPKMVSRHPFLSAWAILMLGWLPWLILRYPAGLEYDAYYQLEEALGFLPLGAKNPFMSSLFMGFWVSLGKGIFGSYNVGLFLLAVVQALLCAACLAYVFLAMGRLGVRDCWRALCLLAFAIAPVYAGYLTAVIKDALFSCLVLLFITLLAEELLRSCTLWHKIALGAAAFGMCALRNNGLYVLILCALALGIGWLIHHKKERLILTAVLTVATVLFIGLNLFLISLLGVEGGSIAEALSVPFQQTARYLKEYPDEVTQEEAEAIDKVLDYENLAALYDPNISDPVKATYKGDGGALLGYFKVWFKQFLRHPAVYFEATLHNTCGYYYPDAHQFVFYETRSHDRLQFESPSALDGARRLLSHWAFFFETAPILMLIGCTGAHFWMAVWMLFKAVQRKKKEFLFLLIPSLAAIAICLAGPTFATNGIRYALPFIYANPLLAGLLFFRKE